MLACSGCYSSMCYTNCPFECVGGERWGGCSTPSMQGSERSHCRDESDEEPDEDSE